MDSGEKVMLFRLRHTSGENYFAGNWISADGVSTPIASTDIKMEPQKVARVAERDIPVDWQVSVISKGLTINTAAINSQSWNSTGFPYWEGPITMGGSHSGIGYLEMTGYLPAK